MKSCQSGCLLCHFRRDRRIKQSDLVSYRTWNLMEGLLYIAKQLPFLLFFHCSGSSAIYQYTALLWLIQSEQQLEDRTFPRSGSASQCDLLSFSDLETEILQNVLLPVTEGDMLKFCNNFILFCILFPDSRLTLLQRFLPTGHLFLFLQSQEFIDPVHTGYC